MPARLPAPLLTLVSTTRRAAAAPTSTPRPSPSPSSPSTAAAAACARCPVGGSGSPPARGRSMPVRRPHRRHRGVPPRYLKYGAAVPANILDQDADGVADDPAVVAELTCRAGTGGPSSPAGEPRRREGDQLGGKRAVRIQLPLPDAPRLR